MIIYRPLVSTVMYILLVMRIRIDVLYLIVKVFDYTVYKKRRNLFRVILL